jgi:RND family efflux transporter MFP subunit
MKLQRQGIATGLTVLLVVGAAVADAAPRWVSSVRDTFRHRLTEVGEIEAVDSQTVTAPLEWRSALQIVHIAPEGSYVQPGDTLVQFDASFLETEIARTRTQLERDRVDLERIFAEQSSRRQALQNALQSAQFSHEQAQLQLDKLEYESESRKQEAQLSLQQAEIARREAQTKLEAQAQLDSLEVAKARLKIAGGEARLKEDFAQVDRMTLTAPGPGLVVYGTKERNDPRKIRLGDEINPGTTVVEIPNLDQVNVEFQIHEVDRERVRVGMPLTLTLEAFPEQVHTAKVLSIAELAQPLEPNSQVKRFTVVARIDAPHPTLKPGMTARLELLLAVQPDVVMAPLTAIFEIDGRPVVYPRDRWPTPVHVEVRNFDEMVAVVEGIDGGVELATEPSSEHPAQSLGQARYRAEQRGESAVGSDER